MGLTNWKDSACRGQYLGELALGRSEDPNYSAFVDKFKSAFDKYGKLLSALTKARDENLGQQAESEYQASLTSFSGQMNQVDTVFSKSAREIDSVISRILLNFPLGYEPEVGAAIRKMAGEGKFRIDLLASAFIGASSRYTLSDQYYRSRFEAKNGLCLDEEYLKNSVESGELGRFLSHTAMSPNVKKKILCRARATKVHGPETIDKIILVGSIGALAVGGAISWGGEALAGAAEEAEVLFASDLKFVGGAFKAVEIGVGIDEMRRKCSPETYASAPPTATPQEVLKCQSFEHAAVMNEPATFGSCALNVTNIGLKISEIPGLSKGANEAIKLAIEALK